MLSEWHFYAEKSTKCRNYVLSTSCILIPQDLKGLLLIVWLKICPLTWPAYMLVYHHNNNIQETSNFHEIGTYPCPMYKKIFWARDNGFICNWLLYSETKGLTDKKKKKKKEDETPHTAPHTFIYLLFEPSLIKFISKYFDKKRGNLLIRGKLSTLLIINTITGKTNTFVCKLQMTQRNGCGK